MSRSASFVYLFARCLPLFVVALLRVVLVYLKRISGRHRERKSERLGKQRQIYNLTSTQKVREARQGARQIILRKGVAHIFSALYTREHRMR